MSQSHQHKSLGRYNNSKSFKFKLSIREVLQIHLKFYYNSSYCQNFLHIHIGQFESKAHIKGEFRKLENKFLPSLYLPMTVDVEASESGLTKD